MCAIREGSFFFYKYNFFVCILYCSHLDQLFIYLYFSSSRILLLSHYYSFLISTSQKILKTASVLASRSLLTVFHKLKQTFGSQTNLHFSNTGIYTDPSRETVIICAVFLQLNSFRSQAVNYSGLQLQSNRHPSDTCEITNKASSNNHKTPAEFSAFCFVIYMNRLRIASGLVCRFTFGKSLTKSASLLFACVLQSSGCSRSAGNVCGEGKCLFCKC